MLILNSPLLSVVMVLLSADGTDKPEALRRAMAARAPELLRTARIEYSIRESSGREDDSVRTRFFTWMCADDRYVLVQRGDEEGVYARGPGGKPLHPALNQPERILVKDSQVWTHTDGALGAHVLGEEGHAAYSLHDWRRVGLNPITLDGDLDETLERINYPPLKYESEEVDGLQVVTGASKGSMVKWWIDPEKDWAIVRTEVFQDGKKIGERRFTLRFDPYDGLWFPRRVELYRLAAGDIEPSSVMETQSAAFNRPDHPMELTPADIGVEVGTSVAFQDRDPPVSGYWDGEKAIPFAELMERIQSGELTMGPAVAQARAKWKAIGKKPELLAEIGRSAQGGGTATTQPILPVPVFVWNRFETQWEAYTRLFIGRYGLDEEQSQKAWSICDDCQESGRAYVAKQRERLEELDRRIRNAKRTGPPKDTADLTRLESERQKLMEPINRIFEQRLKPRLEQLPTRIQRAMGGTPSEP